MNKVIWVKSLSVGVDNLDQQHKALIVLLNKQLKYSEFGQGLEDLKDMLKRLKKYSQIHFKSEEELFTEIDYPDTVNHMNIHSSFIEKIEEYEKQLEDGKIGLPEEVRDFLQNWYLTHIKKEDSKYGDFLKSKKVKS